LKPSQLAEYKDQFQWLFALVFIVFLDMFVFRSKKQMVKKKGKKLNYLTKIKK